MSLVQIPVVGTFLYRDVNSTPAVGERVVFAALSPAYPDADDQEILLPRLQVAMLGAAGQIPSDFTLAVPDDGTSVYFSVTEEFAGGRPAYNIMVNSTMDEIDLSTVVPYVDEIPGVPYGELVEKVDDLTARVEALEEGGGDGVSIAGFDLIEGTENQPDHKRLTHTLTQIRAEQFNGYAGATTGIVITTSGAEGNGGTAGWKHDLRGMEFATSGDGRLRIDVSDELPGEGETVTKYPVLAAGRTADGYTIDLPVQCPSVVIEPISTPQPPVEAELTLDPVADYVDGESSWHLWTDAVFVNGAFVLDGGLGHTAMIEYIPNAPTGPEGYPHTMVVNVYGESSHPNLGIYGGNGDAESSPVQFVDGVATFELTKASSSVGQFSIRTVAVGDIEFGEEALVTITAVDGRVTVDQPDLVSQGNLALHNADGGSVSLRAAPDVGGEIEVHFPALDDMETGVTQTIATREWVAANTTSRLVIGPNPPASETHPPGEYFWVQTDGSGTLIGTSVVLLNLVE